jgi:hypothetical protein
MTIIGTAATGQESDSKVSPKQTYQKPTLRIYGACQLLTATVSGTSANRDQQGGGNVKTH